MRRCVDFRSSLSRDEMVVVMSTPAAKEILS